MTTHPDSTVRVPPSELGPVIGFEECGPYGDEECRVDWDDGSCWFLSRMDCGGIYAERWHEPDELERGDFGPWRDCPGPDLGVFASVDGIEVAMGAPLPEEIYNLLYVHDFDSIVTDGEKAAWGRSCAFEIAHLLDGRND